MRRPNPLLGFLAACGVLAGGCGTYSLVRPADTLKRGQFDLGVGAATNELGEFVPHLRVHCGIKDWLEVGAHFEVYSALGEVRFGLLSTKKHGFALAIGVGGGMASRIAGDIKMSTAVGSVTVGRRWKWFELYLGHRILYLPQIASAINTTKLGARFTVKKLVVLGLEAGPTVHHGLTVLGEAAATFGLIF